MEKKKKGKTRQRKKEGIKKKKLKLNFSFLKLTNKEVKNLKKEKHCRNNLYFSFMSFNSQ